MKVLLTLVLAVCWLRLYAQEPAATSVYTDAKAPYHLTYPNSWQRHQNKNQTQTTFYASNGTGRAAEVTITSSLLSPNPRVSASLLAQGQQDSVWRSIQRLPQAYVLRLDQHAAGNYQEIRYHYTFASAATPAVRTRVVGRRIWGGGYELNLEYRAATSQDSRYRAQGEQLVESFRFTGTSVKQASTTQQCDAKMYGIAALRIVNDMWEDDCRTIHEFSATNPSESPKIHREVLPFQSYALAKGFDNCLYSVTKAPSPNYRRG